MNFPFEGLGIPVLSLVFLFFAVTALLWLLLPFSIFGIKAKLDEQLRVLRSLDARLERLERTQRIQTLHPARPEASAADTADPGAANPPAVEEPDQAFLDDQSRGSGDPPMPGGDARWQKPVIGDGG